MCSLYTVRASRLIMPDLRVSLRRAAALQWHVHVEWRHVADLRPAMVQMMGRASRPNVDDGGRCVLMCHTPRKEYYKKVRGSALLGKMGKCGYAVQLHTCGIAAAYVTSALRDL